MLEVIAEQTESRKEAIRAAVEAKASADKGQWDEAREAMSRAIDGAPDDATYHALMAWYTYQCSMQPPFERQRLAEHHLTVALEMDPENHQAHYYQGLIWAGGGNTTRARIALSQALNLKPGFQAAAQALDKLTKPSEPAPSSKETLPAAFVKPSKAKLVVPLAIGTLLAAAAGAAMIFSSPAPAGAADLAKQLGTHLPLVSTSRVGSGGQDLHIDVGSAWGTLSAGDQATEMHAIAKGAQAMGIINVFVYSASQPVAESHGDAVCVGDCLQKPPMKPVGARKPAALKISKH